MTPASTRVELSCLALPLSERDGILLGTIAYLIQVELRTCRRSADPGAVCSRSPFDKLSIEAEAIVVYHAIEELIPNNRVQSKIFNFDDFSIGPILFIHLLLSHLLVDSLNLINTIVDFEGVNIYIKVDSGNDSKYYI